MGVKERKIIIGGRGGVVGSRRGLEGKMERRSWNCGGEVTAMLLLKKKILWIAHRPAGMPMGSISVWQVEKGDKLFSVEGVEGVQQCMVYYCPFVLGCCRGGQRFG